ncbi:MAG TPA: hypothetical protein VFJ43_14880 [Bacteroidia bacterium]|nr:hypothetical protein [Bacteroidia bacterium]
MEKKNGMIYFYGAVIFIGFGVLALLQFYPELFKIDKSTRGILEIVLAVIGFVVVGLWEKERKKGKGDLN